MILDLRNQELDGKTWMQMLWWHGWRAGLNWTCRQNVLHPKIQINGSVTRCTGHKNDWLICECQVLNKRDIKSGKVLRFCKENVGLFSNEDRGFFSFFFPTFTIKFQKCAFIFWNHPAQTFWCFGYSDGRAALSVKPCCPEVFVPEWGAVESKVPAQTAELQLFPSWWALFIWVRNWIQAAPAQLHCHFWLDADARPCHCAEKEKRWQQDAEQVEPGGQPGREPGGLCSFSAWAVPLPERGKAPGVPKFSL